MHAAGIGVVTTVVVGIVAALLSHGTISGAPGSVIALVPTLVLAGVDNVANDPHAESANADASTTTRHFVSVIRPAFHDIIRIVFRLEQGISS